MAHHGHEGPKLYGHVLGERLGPGKMVTFGELEEGRLIAFNLGAVSSISVFLLSGENIMMQSIIVTSWSEQMRGLCLVKSALVLWKLRLHCCAENRWKAGFFDHIYYAFRVRVHPGRGPEVVLLQTFRCSADFSLDVAPCCHFMPT